MSNCCGLIGFVLVITIWCIGIATGSICSYSINGIPSCCRGFSKNVYGDCVKNFCSNDCGFGECMGNNLCKCPDGSYTTDTCLNKAISDCKQNCNSHGKCINGKCRCSAGYTGRYCSKPINSTCYISINRGLCISKFPSETSVPILSLEECCAIFDVAWGLPCQKCKWKYISRCGRGFKFVNGRCEDIDECRISGICENGQCSNQPGSFKCYCPPNFKYNKTSYACEQDNPCSRDDNLCKPFGSCVNEGDSKYHCKCPSTYQLSNDRKRCVKKNQYNVCSIFKTLCSPYGSCVPNGYSYRCKCHNGYYATSDGKGCKMQAKKGICDDGKISINQCQGGICNNRGPDDYTCTCLSGFEATNDRRFCKSALLNKRRCDDVSFIMNQCKGGRCINKGFYDYECSCRSGYKLSRDRRSCTKSQQVNGRCSDGSISKNQCRGGRCINKGFYDYECSCLSGYESSRDKKSCRKINTNNDGNKYCSIPNIRARCQGGSCLGDREFGFRCTCLPGFKASSDRRACDRIQQSQRPCDDGRISRNQCRGGRCINRGYSDYECNCLSGYEVSRDRKSCNKVQQAQRPCDDGRISRNQCKGGSCINRGYSDYECTCLSGYEVSSDRRYCQKVQRPCDDGQISRNQCKRGVCINRGYSDYECECLSGYELSDDRRYCKKPEQPCDDGQISRNQCKGGACINIGYSDYKCKCLSGYYLSSDRKYCQKGLCNDGKISKDYCKGGRCINKGYSDYECRCLPGYEMSHFRKYCVKIQQIQRPCDDGRISRNQCRGGRCINRGYSDYECNCLSGYEVSRDRKSCKKVEQAQRPCDDGRIGRNQCRGGSCINIGYRDYECNCLFGYEVSRDRKYCNKIQQAQRPCDDGRIGRNQCRGGRCINRGYSDYECNCLSGYTATGDRKYCKKIEPVPSENDSDNYYCKIPKYRSRCKGGKCYGDKAYGFQCECLPGYKASKDKRACYKDMTKNSAVLSNYDQNNGDAMQYCQIAKLRKMCEPGTCKPNKELGFECICPRKGYRTSKDRRSCKKENRMLAGVMNRPKRSVNTNPNGKQSSRCPFCKFGCSSSSSNKSHKLQCLCPQNFNLINATSFCISKQVNSKVMHQRKCITKSNSLQSSNTTKYSIAILIKIPPFLNPNSTNSQYKNWDYYLVNLYKTHRTQYVDCEKLNPDGLIYKCYLKCLDN